jgi:adenine-specific DNA-methyltransferase
MIEIFNHIYEFFSRYYDKGGFYFQKRYSSKEKYCLPYNGEEVVFSWANKDQYYVKNTEFFQNIVLQRGNLKLILY